MPVVNLSIPDISQSFTRPVLMNIIHEVQQILKIKTDVRIFFPGMIEVNPTPKTTLDEENDRRALFGTERQLFIEVEEAYNEDELSSTAINQQENNVFFLDQLNQFAIWPIYNKVDYTINFKYQTNSRTEADRWMQDFRMRISQMRDTPLHKADYHYNLPNPIWQLINAIYENHNRLQLPEQTVDEYVRLHASQRLKMVADTTGKNTLFVISERQSRIVGQFTISPVPEKVERNSDTAGWLCNFSYKVSIMRPEGIGARYPIMVANKLLPDDFIVFPDNPNDPVTYLATQTKSLNALSKFEIDQDLRNRLNLYVPYKVPEFDEFKIKHQITGYANLISALIEVNETDKLSLINLENDLEPYVFDEDILQFIKESEYPYIGKIYESVLHLGLYKNYNFYADNMLVCDNQLNIAAQVPLDIRQIFHVVPSICVDLSYLKQPAIDRLKKYPKVFVKIMILMNESLRDNPDLAVLANRNYITKRDFDQFYRLQVNYNDRYGKPTVEEINPDYIEFNSVMFAGIIAMSKKLL